MGKPKHMPPDVVKRYNHLFQPCDDCGLLFTQDWIDFVRDFPHVCSSCQQIFKKAKAEGDS